MRGIDRAIERFEDRFEKNGDDEFALEDILDILEEERDRGEWISCDERLPEEPATYLVAFEPTVISTPFFNGSFYGNNPTEPGLMKLKLVTHWQPLPKAPRGE